MRQVESASREIPKPVHSMWLPPALAVGLCSRLFFVCWFGRSWFLALLQLLLLLSMFLFQLLGLLLVSLL